MPVPARSRRGNAAIFAFTLIPLLGFGALSVDIGLQRLTNVQIQAAAEAAAVGGAAYLNGSTQGLTDAITKAAAIGNANFVYGGYQMAGEVEIGIYDVETGVFSPQPATYDAPQEINAVRVTPVHAFDSVLARFAFGVTTLDATGEALAVVPRSGVARYVDCYLPFAIPKCTFLGLAQGTNPPPMKLELGNMNSVAWGHPGVGGVNPGPPSTSYARELLNDACSQGTTSVSDVVNIGNGQNTSALHEFADIVNDAGATRSAEPWPAFFNGGVPYARDGVTGNAGPADSVVDAGSPPWGYNVNGVIPIVDTTNTSNCNGDSLTENTAPIVGWTYAYIYDAKIVGQDGKNIWMQFDFVNEYDVGRGECTGDCYGNVTGTSPPTMAL